MLLQASAHEAHVQAWADTHRHGPQCISGGRTCVTQRLRCHRSRSPALSPAAALGLSSRSCRAPPVWYKVMTQNSCGNAHFLQTQKDELLGSFSTLPTWKCHLTVSCFQWWTEMKIWKYVYIYIHRHIYTTCLSVFCTQKLDTYSHPRIAFESY